MPDDPNIEDINTPEASTTDPEISQPSDVLDPLDALDTIDEPWVKELEKKIEDGDFSLSDDIDAPDLDAEPEEKTKEEVEDTELAPVIDDEPDDLAELPEETPKPDDWKKMRGIHKDNKARIKELEDKLAGKEPPAVDEGPPTLDMGLFGSFQEAVGGTAQPTEQPQVQPQQQPTVPQAGFVQPQLAQPPQYQQPPLQDTTGFTADVFMTMAKADLGEIESQAAQTAQGYVQQISPQDALTVIQRADMNAYGEHSREIASLARQRLPEIQQNYQLRIEQQNAVNGWDAQRKQALQEVAKLEGMVDPKSDQYREYASASVELAKLIPTLRVVPTAPTIIMEYMHLKQKAVQADSEIPKMQKEITKLRKKLGLSVEPEKSGNKAVSPEPVKKDAEATLREEVRELGLGSLVD